MTTKRQPLLGETWTVQSCMRHGPPLLNVGINWVKHPVVLGVTMVSDVTILQYSDRIECGCMDFGDVPPRLHRADEKPQHHVPNTPIPPCESRIMIAQGTDGFQCELPGGHEEKLHQARVLGVYAEKGDDHEGRLDELGPDAVVYVRWEAFDDDRDADVEWHPD